MFFGDHFILKEAVCRAQILKMAQSLPYNGDHWFVGDRPQVT